MVQPKKINSGILFLFRVLSVRPLLKYDGGVMPKRAHVHLWQVCHTPVIFGRFILCIHILLHYSKKTQIWDHGHHDKHRAHHELDFHWSASESYYPLCLVMYLTLSPLSPLSLTHITPLPPNPWLAHHLMSPSPAHFLSMTYIILRVHHLLLNWSVLPLTDSHIKWFNQKKLILAFFFYFGFYQFAPY